MGAMDNGMETQAGGDWDDWRQGECLLPALVGKFYDQQSFMDVTFQLADSSTVAANELLLAITSPVFEAIFFIHLADRNLREVRVEDVKPSGFKRLVHFIYNSPCLSWRPPTST